MKPLNQNFICATCWEIADVDQRGAFCRKITVWLETHSPRLESTPIGGAENRLHGGGAGKDVEATCVSGMEFGLGCLEYGYELLNVDKTRRRQPI